MSFTPFPLIPHVLTTDLRRSTCTSLELHHSQRGLVELSCIAIDTHGFDLCFGRKVDCLHSHWQRIREFHTFTFGPSHSHH